MAADDPADSTEARQRRAEARDERRDASEGESQRVESTDEPSAVSEGAGEVAPGEAAPPGPSASRPLAFLAVVAGTGAAIGAVAVAAKAIRARGGSGDETAGDEEDRPSPDGEKTDDTDGSARAGAAEEESDAAHREPVDESGEGDTRAQTEAEASHDETVAQGDGDDERHGPGEEAAGGETGDGAGVRVDEAESRRGDGEGGTPGSQEPQIEERDGEEPELPSEGREAGTPDSRESDSGERGGDGPDAAAYDSPHRSVEIVRTAGAQLEELTGRKPEAVLGVDRRDRQWLVTFELVELSRIPSSTDVLGSYEVVVDEDGGLVRYERTRRYRRSESDDGGE